MGDFNYNIIYVVIIKKYYFSVDWYRSKRVPSGGAKAHYL